ncbi:D-serine deaminase, pyridoxal phosphate-dependent [Flavobacterium sp. CF108]|uniref:D-TA family PLP-dependent enzyme n=1 Tax=unclassified Flavobacterium TaxID=196869 RepID=UPI0008CDE0F7|nr:MULTISPECIES: D-TA family PLP-dependent enzyme [unclassified Flavobacterium]SEP14760.1 D-serine deaminase, pyridoxal phosphate-dependent [Flavobacterium sp. fv08]SHH49085.1 D-serine deaminase, pyridoxal phosphate-dependent [Flavobacterium sp. CF108]
MQENWWKIKSDINIDTPFLAAYEDRIRFNLERLIGSVNGDTQKLRPHIKTHKIGEILELFKIYNIKKIKCATIAEAELGAIHEIPDVLLAYQPIGIKKERWISLIQKYPDTSFSTIVDNLDSAKALNEIAKENDLELNVYLDLNTGMNRTGFSISEDWTALIDKIIKLKNLHFEGIHIYDGHLKGSAEERTNTASSSFSEIKEKTEAIEQKLGYELKIVAGGSNTFPFYATQENVECSPGTFVFWDSNYQIHLPEQKFKPALVIVGTIISKPTNATLCIDIGYKAVASENPIDKRLVILNDENLIPTAHSEEHLILENKGKNEYKIGDTIYALPYHVCPTCALYDAVQVVNKGHQICDQWKVAARSREINI